MTPPRMAETRHFPALRARARGGVPLKIYRKNQLERFIAPRLESQGVTAYRKFNCGQGHAQPIFAIDFSDRKASYFKTPTIGRPPVISQSDSDKELQAKYDKLSDDYKLVVEAVHKSLPGCWKLDLCKAMQAVYDAMKKEQGL